MGKGVFKDEASAKVQKERPDLEVQLFEAPAPLCSVVSWDQVHVQNGYRTNFFGCYEEDLRSLKAGDPIEFIGSGKQGNLRFTFVQSGGKRSKEQKKDGKMIRYLYVKENSFNVLMSRPCLARGTIARP